MSLSNKSNKRFPITCDSGVEIIAVDRYLPLAKPGICFYLNVYCQFTLFYVNSVLYIQIHDIAQEELKVLLYDSNDELYFRDSVLNLEALEAVEMVKNRIKRNYLALFDKSFYDFI